VAKSDNADSGPKGQENIAQTLAWVGQRNTLSPVGAGETRAPINSRYSVCQKEHNADSDFHCTISRPYGAITVGGELPSLKPGLSSQGPSGRHADLSDDLSAMSSDLSAEALAKEEGSGVSNDGRSRGTPAAPATPNAKRRTPNAERPHAVSPFSINLSSLRNSHASSHPPFSWPHRTIPC